MKADEIIHHPEFSNVTWKLPPSAKGKIKVAESRGGPIDIAYEIHGTGPIHILWLMGLGGLKTAWQRQTKDFGHDHGSTYSCLILDNRGIGESDKPLMRYSTSLLAMDVLEVLDSQEVNWTDNRSIHVVGISMGGMVAQELAYLQPGRIASLSLLSTAARLVNTMGYFANLIDRIGMFMPKSTDDQLEDTKSRMFTEKWLNAPDEIGGFPTNGDRYSAQEIQKRQDKTAFSKSRLMCQAMAAGWHHKSPAQLEEIGERVGRNRIQVVHGTADKMITFHPHADTLVSELGGEQAGVTKTIFEGAGHVVPIEERKAFFELIQGFVERTSALDQ